MDVFLYIILFMMGTFFGSFFTLAVYRIPLKKDITHEHSFCPNCNHKLGFLDLIPVWSYLFLKGKCRYCGEKVRIRYLVLEVISGIVFVLAYASFHVQNIFVETGKISSFVAFVFLYVTLVLVAGIDKEYRKINTSVLLFGGIFQAIYMIYLYIVEKTIMYRYIIYFLLFISMNSILMVLQKKKEYYIGQIILLFTYILLIFDFKSTLLILALSFGVTLLLARILRINYPKMPIGFVICISTIVYQIVENIIEFWII